MVGIAVPALVVAGVVAGDWWESNRELDTLLDQMEASQQVIRAANEEMSNEVAGINRAAPTAADDQAYATAQTQAIEVSGELAASRSDAEGLLVLPWHRSTDRARDAYVDYTRSWSAYFDDAATRPLDDWTDDLKALLLSIYNDWKVVEARLPEAVPPLPLHDSSRRVDALLDGK